MGARTDNPTPVCVLAGGLSRRLRPLTEDIPKPMVSVAGRPFMHHLLEHLGSLGFGRFILAACYRWEAIRDYFGDGSSFGWRIEYSVEPEPLGTGGAVLWARSLWQRRVLVVNGDTYLSGDFAGMLAAHDAAGLPVTMAVVWREDRSGFGEARVADGRVVEFVAGAGGGAPGWINGGAYVLEASALAGRRRGEAFSLERDVIDPLAGRIGAFCCRDVTFADIGTPESLEAFRRSRTR